MKTYLAEPVDANVVKKLDDDIKTLTLLTSERFNVQKTMAAYTHTVWTQEVTVPEGYTLLTIAGIQTVGANVARCKCTLWRPTGNSVYLRFHNSENISVTFDIVLDLVWIKTDYYQEISYI